MSSSDMPPPPPNTAPSAFHGGPSQPAGRGDRRNAKCVASLILGIVSVPLFWLWIPQVLSIGLGIMGLRRCSKDPTQRGRWMAITGIVLGLFAMVIVVPLIFIMAG